MTEYYRRMQAGAGKLNRLSVWRLSLIHIYGNRFHTKEEVFMPTIFLSHTSIDKPFVEKLARDLQRLGISVWYDKYEIKVGESLSGGRYG